MTARVLLASRETEHRRRSLIAMLASSTLLMQQIFISTSRLIVPFTGICRVRR